jgi:hypothetical protein
MRAGSSLVAVLWVLNILGCDSLYSRIANNTEDAAMGNPSKNDQMPDMKIEDLASPQPDGFPLSYPAPSFYSSSSGYAMVDFYTGSNANEDVRVYFNPSKEDMQVILYSTANNFISKTVDLTSLPSNPGNYNSINEMVTQNTLLIFNGGTNNVNGINYIPFYFVLDVHAETLIPCSSNTEVPTTITPPSSQDTLTAKSVVLSRDRTSLLIEYCDMANCTINSWPMSALIDNCKLTK